MKMILLILSMFFSFTVLAVQSPFQPWEQDLIKAKIMKMDSGKVLIGSSAGKATATTISGDFTISNAGVGAITAGALTAADIALANGKILIGGAGGVSAAQTFTGDVTVTNAGVTSIASGVITDGDFQAGSIDTAVLAKRMARATYDVAVEGGAIGAYSLGVSLPANAIITRSWFYTVTQFTDAGAGTVALHCQTANNIYNAADITGNAAGVMVTGIQDNAIANFGGTGAAGVLGTACDLTATVAGADQTAGKLVLFVEYVIAE